MRAMIIAERADAMDEVMIIVTGLFKTAGGAIHTAMGIPVIATAGWTRCKAIFAITISPIIMSPCVIGATETAG